MSTDLEYYLKEINFDKQYKKLLRKYKNKKLVVYGAGQLFETIKEKYDLSKLDIIAVSDGKYTASDIGQEFLGYKKVPLDKIAELKPDYIFVSTLKYLSIIENFEDNVFKNTKIKIRPLAPKGFWQTLKDIWYS